MAACLWFRSGKNARDHQDKIFKIPLYFDKDFTVKRAAEEQSPSLRVASFNDADSCVHLDSLMVSKNHFRIYSIQYEDADGIESMFYCEDSGSTNGTFVNNILIGKSSAPGNPFLLSDGDKIAVKPGFSFNFRQHIERQTEEINLSQLEETASFARRYSITDRLLGSGIYGKVYLATEVATKRQLACKVVNLRPVVPTSSEDGQANASQGQTMRRERQRLMREVEILTMVNHPNIVSMKKAFRSNNSFYLFMELAPGGDLCSFVSASGGYLTDVVTRVIIRQVTVAVQYLHSLGIVHRDIKPENILMTSTAVGHRVVLTDFGCAANLRQAGRMESLVGTFDYVAPEVHRTERLNGESYTKAVDMWSLGIVALCLLTGEALASYLEMKHINQKDIEARLSRLRPDPKCQDHGNSLTGRSKEFVEKLLVLDAARRMTADQAVDHRWFSYPAEVADELNLLYRRSVQGWIPRKQSDGIIESIPRKEISGDSDDPDGDSQKEQRHSRKSKDCTASVYFSLDKHTHKHSNRHLRTRMATQKSKQQIINALEKSGELFVKHADVSTYTSPKRKRERTLLKKVRGVPPTDLFGNAPAGANSQKPRSRKSSKFSQYSNNVSTRSNSSGRRLKRPRLDSESLSMISSGPDRKYKAVKRLREDTSSLDNWYGDLPDDEYTQPGILTADKSLGCWIISRDDDV
ncbi:hypothetical protein V494_07556 [Pseudogymnoascus sp. VKM F-4513 (FW-928)]|nr:hypothetical protein V494_07556 [Pseudogymnoascus sp. VKM F-4513 (FW-928)]